MQVSSSLHSSNTVTSNSSDQLHHPTLGISNTPSSIEMRLQAQASSGGFCSCITDFIDRICRFLGLSSSQQSSSTPHIVSSLQSRVFIGKEILNNHFQSDAIRIDNGQHSAIAVIMNYNGRNVVSIASANAQRDCLDVLKDRLENLISQDTPLQANAQLQINTVFFKKNNNLTFTYLNVDERVSFQGDSSNRQGPISACAGSLDFTTIARNVNALSCPQDRKEEIKLFLARL